MNTHPGYEPLAALLQEALDRAQSGKGVERHGRGDAFDSQIGAWIARRGLSFARGQIVKKADESQALENAGRIDAAVREMLDIAVYAMIQVIGTRAKQETPRPAAMCGRCYAEGEELSDAPCRPVLKGDLAIGMHTCPDCGAMVLPNLPHPPLCGKCLKEVKAPPRKRGRPKGPRRPEKVIAGFRGAAEAAAFVLEQAALSGGAPADRLEAAAAALRRNRRAVARVLPPPKAEKVDTAVGDALRVIDLASRVGGFPARFFRFAAESLRGVDLNGSGVLPGKAGKEAAA